MIRSSQPPFPTPHYQSPLVSIHVSQQATAVLLYILSSRPDTGQNDKGNCFSPSYLALHNHTREMGRLSQYLRDCSAHGHDGKNLRAICFTRTCICNLPKVHGSKMCPRCSNTLKAVESQKLGLKWSLWDSVQRMPPDGKPARGQAHISCAFPSFQPKEGQELSCLCLQNTKPFHKSSSVVIYILADSLLNESLMDHRLTSKLHLYSKNTCKSNIWSLPCNTNAGL
jgi:hypothetical protein